MSPIRYRELTTMEAFGRVMRLEMRTWGMARADTIPTNLLRAVAFAGGVVLGAEDPTKPLDDDGLDQLVGASLAFPARRNGEWLLWSHFTAVDPRYQRRGIGLGLKRAQRTWALANGYSRIGWTFDPMQRGNANFNLRKLGAFAASFSANHYGAMADGINIGTRTDRLVAEWDLNSARVRDLNEGPGAPERRDTAGQFLLNVSQQGKVLVTETPHLDAETYLVEIPYDRMAVIQQDVARFRHWQAQLAEVLPRAFAAGYVALDFVSDHTNQRCWYILIHRQNLPGLATWPNHP